MSLSYKNLTVDGVEIGIAAESVQQNWIYHIRIEGVDYRVYAESVLDKTRKPSERYGEILYLKDIKSSLDEKSYNRILDLIKKAMPLSYDKEKDPFIFFEYKDF